MIDQDTTSPESASANLSVIDPSSEVAEVADGDTGGAGRPKWRWRHHFSRLKCRPRTAALLLVVVVAAVTVITVVLNVRLQRPDTLRQQAVGQVLEAATSGATAVLSYSPGTVDRDVVDARSHLVGEFADYYAKFAQDIVAPAAKTKGVEATANVVRAAVSDLQTDKATVLLYINQTTVSTEKPDPALAASSVLVSLDRTDGRWLISKFEPV